MISVMRIPLLARWTIAAAVTVSSAGCALHGEVSGGTGPEPVESGVIVPSDPPKPPTECIGAVRYDMELVATDLDGVPAMCFKVGSTLRMQGIGPGELTVKPESSTSVHYEGGVDDVRFDRAGKVTLTFPVDAETRTIVVTVKS